MRCPLALLICLILPGCAGSPVDRDFREKVRSVTVDTSGHYDPTTKASSGSIRASFEFRDPRTEGLAK